MTNRLKVNAAKKLIECAKREFLQNGYESSSLREIAACAGVSTYLIYRRFTDKAGLLDAVVAPAKSQLVEAYRLEMERFNLSKPDAAYEDMKAYTEENCAHILDVIYEEFENFRLVVSCPIETGYQDLIHALADIHVRQVHIYFDAIGNDVLSRISPELLHIVSSSMLSGLFEVVRHSMSYEAALIYYQQLLKFHMTGFQAFL